MNEDNTIFISKYQSPCGELIIGSYGDCICLCDWMSNNRRDKIDRRLKAGLNTSFTNGTSPVIMEAKAQLDEYFNKKRFVFSIPLLFVGTDFQKRVWDALLDIPFGSTTTYIGLARSIGRPSAVRAVANATGANAISILVPCHRIIGSDGSLTGYAGGLEAKRFLLCLESQ